MSHTRHVCPACWRTVQPTRNGAIAGHFDHAGTVCPASFEPFYITLQETPPSTRT